jgi:hydrogenase maturation protease
VTPVATTPLERHAAARRTPMRVVGVGQAWAGDDGAGLAVIDRLRRRPPPGVQLEAVSDPTRLIDALEALEGDLVVVDAVLGPAAGEVLDVDPGRLSCVGRSASSHGFSVAEALALAGAVRVGPAARVRVIAIGIRRERPRRGQHGLSPPVARGVVRAARAVAALCRA